MKPSIFLAMLLSFVIQAICASEAAAFSEKGRLILENYLKNGEIVFRDGDPRHLNDPVFQANAECQAYFMMKMMEDGGRPNDTSVNARSGKHYFLENMKIADSKNYNGWETWSYALWEIQLKGRDALAGKLDRPEKCLPSR